MKTKPVLSIGRRNYEVLKYLSNRQETKFNKINKKFNFNGNGIFVKQLLEMGFLERPERGYYKITNKGIKAIEICE